MQLRYEHCKTMNHMYQTTYKQIDKIKPRRKEVEKYGCGQQVNLKIKRKTKRNKGKRKRTEQKRIKGKGKETQATQRKEKWPEGLLGFRVSKKQVGVICV